MVVVDVLLAGDSICLSETGVVRGKQYRRREDSRDSQSCSLPSAQVEHTDRAFKRPRR